MAQQRTSVDKSKTAPVEKVVGNMDLWNRLNKTDPKATKPYNNGRFTATQVDPYYRYQLMTEVFGPCGKGWGYDLTDPIITGALVFIGAKAWYIDPDTKEKMWSGMQYGGDSLAKGKGGAVNDDALKMAVTDAVGKALSLIGVAADIYLGQFDDAKHVAEMTVFHEAKTAYPPQKIEKFKADTIAAISQIGSTEDLEAYYKNDDFRESLRCIGIVDKAAKDRVIEAFSDRKRELVEAEEAARRAEKTGKGTPKAETPAEPPAETEAEPEDTGEAPGYEGSIQQQADRDQAEFLSSEEQAEQPAEQQEETAQEERNDRPEQAPVYEFDVTAYVNKPPKTLPVQKPDEEAPDWERFTKIALKIVQHIPSGAWGQRWMDINGGTIDRLEKEGVIMERDGVEYVGKQAAKWIDNAYNKRMAALQSGGGDRRERA